MGNNLSCKQREVILRKQLKNQTQYCKYLLENNKRQSKFRHDIKTYCLCLEDFLDKEDVKGARDYIDSMYQMITEGNSVLDTNNPIFDALMFEKIRRAEKESLYIDWEVSIGRELNISEVAWCVLVGCTLDHAIEACRRVKNQEKNIVVRIKCVGNTLSVYMKYSEEQGREPDRMAKSGHGREKEDFVFDFEILQKLISQYQGVMESSHSEGFFELKFLLCDI